ncbi:hypothetical protein [Streptomyces sp. NPDC001221]
MSPEPNRPGPVRSADDLNEEIRALWQRAGDRLGPEDRAEYERLVVAWAAAVRAERDAVETA